MQGKIASIILLLCFIIPGPNYAQDNNLNFFHLSRSDGLSDDRITDIVKDRDGFVWISTQRGLNRYDGTNFKVFLHSEDSLSLPDNNIKDLFVSSTCTLWVLMEHYGVSCYDSRSESFRSYPIRDLPDVASGSHVVGMDGLDSSLYLALSNDIFLKKNKESGFANITRQVLGDESDSIISDGPLIQAISASGDSGLWIGLAGRRVLHYNPGTKKSYLFHPEESIKSTRHIINSLIEYQGKLWIGGLGPTFSSLDPETGETQVFLENEDLYIINSISLSGSRFWLASANGLIKFSPETGRYKIYRSSERNTSALSHSSTTSFLKDTSGIVWVGLDGGGVNYSYPDLAFKHYPYGDGFLELSHHTVQSILHDSRGNLWIGHGGGIVSFHDKFRRKRKDFRISPVARASNAGTIFKLLEDNHGNVYCLSWRGGIQKYDPELETFRPLFGSAAEYNRIIGVPDIRDAIFGQDGLIWLSAHGKGLYKIDLQNKKRDILRRGEEPDGISSNWLYDLEEDGSGNIWAGAAYGLTRINPETGTVTQFTLGNGDSILTDDIHPVVFRDDKGNIWTGTEKGLNYFNLSEQRFYAFNQTDGLPWEDVRSIIQDSTGRFWIGTPFGLASFNITDDSDEEPILTGIEYFTSLDGLIQDNFNMGCVSMDRESNLYFSGFRGLVFFNPYLIKRPDVMPELYITEVSIYGKAIYPGTENGPDIGDKGMILLNHEENMLGVDFAVRDYFNSGIRDYAYILEPVSDKWINTSNDNLYFSNLKPGEYSLSLRVRLENNRTIEAPEILRFSISPPFWQTPLFMVLVLIAGLFIIFLSVRIYTLNLRRTKVELERMVAVRTRDLKESNEELKNQKSRIEKQARELISQQKKLSAINQDLEEVNSTKDQLFSIVAHDLRNPFGAVSGIVEMMMNQYDNFDDEKKKELLQAVYKSVNTTSDLLDNLLQWSRSQSGTLKVKQEILKLDPLFRNQKELFETPARQKGIHFTTRLEKNLRCYADKNLLNTVLRNLISNAVKFTSKNGSIELSAKALNHEGIEIKVSDTGIGMKKEYLQKIMIDGRYKSSKGTEGEAGTGLGLMLCKEFIQKMEGDLDIKSIEGEGTHVIIHLPVE